MRIRMTRPVSEEIDGIDVSSLRAGAIYDLPATLATYLILNAAAEPTEARATDSEEERIAVNVETWRGVAANGTTERRKKPGRSSRNKLR